MPGSLSLPKAVKLVEVGPRDGLQSEKQILSLATKVKLVDQLSQTGIGYIEAGSFVSEKWIRQMASSDQLFAQITRQPEITYAALTPNLRGLERALRCNVNEVAIFASASESFSQKNLNCSIQESLRRFEPVVEMAMQYGIKVRGYLSCVAGCPYEGQIAVSQVAAITRTLLALGCYEVSLGDTIGVGTPMRIHQLLDTLAGTVPTEQLAVHMHDTYGQALANIFMALQMGVRVIDSSVAGLGGCPYAKGASGNVATEDVVYLLNGLGIEHGVNLEALIQVGEWICRVLNKTNNSKVSRAMTGDSPS
jgi:hydroxymethylglutaryl-CoA lyase